VQREIIYRKTYDAALRRFKYRLVVDESLALGVLGRTGRGACEHFGLTRDDVEITSASLGARNWLHPAWQGRHGSGSKKCNSDAVP